MNKKAFFNSLRCCKDFLTKNVKLIAGGSVVFAIGASSSAVIGKKILKCQYEALTKGSQAEKKEYLKSVQTYHRAVDTYYETVKQAASVKKNDECSMTETRFDFDQIVSALSQSLDRYKALEN